MQSCKKSGPLIRMEDYVTRKVDDQNVQASHDTATEMDIITSSKMEQLDRKQRRP